MKGGNGVHYPASLNLKPKGKSRRRQRFGIHRAVVVNTTATDVEGVTGPRKAVVCDITYLRSLQPKLGVPVALGLGVNDGEAWSPKPTTATLSGADLTLPRVFGKRGSREGEATPADDYNGDIVLVQFIEGDPEFPMITGRMTHEESNRLPVDGPGWDADLPSSPATGLLKRGIPAIRELYRRFAGTEQRINETGLKHYQKNQFEWLAAAFYYYHHLKKVLPKKNHKTQLFKLTYREQQCLMMTADDMRVERIAEALNITERTVHFHLQNANKKLGTKNKYQAVNKWINLHPDVA